LGHEKVKSPGAAPAASSSSPSASARRGGVMARGLHSASGRLRGLLGAAWRRTPRSTRGELSGGAGGTRFDDFHFRWRWCGSGASGFYRERVAFFCCIMADWRARVTFRQTLHQTLPNSSRTPTQLQSNQSKQPINQQSRKASQPPTTKNQRPKTADPAFSHHMAPRIIGHIQAPRIIGPFPAYASFAHRCGVPPADPSTPMCRSPAQRLSLPILLHRLANPTHPTIPTAPSSVTPHAVVSCLAC
jgi:hypothetical protein